MMFVFAAIAVALTAMLVAGVLLGAEDNSSPSPAGPLPGQQVEADIPARATRGRRNLRLAC
jgi:hypothetical protein